MDAEFGNIIFENIMKVSLQNKILLRNSKVHYILRNVHSTTTNSFVHLYRVKSKRVLVKAKQY